MKYKLIIILFLILSCEPQFEKLSQKPYTAKGFAYIYNETDFDKKIIKGKMDNNIMQISNQNLELDH